MTITKRRFMTHSLTGMERPNTLYEYYVTGRGHFPWDMLRYDRCWPVSGEDAAKLECYPISREIRSIKLHSYREPTIDRWASFIWSVGTEKLG